MISAVNSFAVLRSLHPNYNYQCSITAATVVGSGPRSVASHIQMPEDGTFNKIIKTSLFRVNIIILKHNYDPLFKRTCSLLFTTQKSYMLHMYCMNKLDTFQFLLFVSTILCYSVVPTSPPLEFTKASLSPLSLTWQAPSIGNQNGALTGYTLRVSEGARDNVYMLETLSPSYTNASLLKFTNYTFAVAAETAVGVGPFTDPIAVTTPAGG